MAAAISVGGRDGSGKIKSQFQEAPIEFWGGRQQSGRKGAEQSFSLFFHLASWTNLK
jgi:hypothetical protein